MENTNSQAPATKKTPEEISAAWSKMGLSISNTDSKLQLMAQSAIQKIKIPTSVNEITEAEKLVVELRADYNAIVEERKKVTSKLDGVISHLMEPEKTITPAVKPLTDAILSLKQQAEAAANKAKYHAEEIKRIKEQIATHISNHDASCKRKIVELVDKAYSYALGNGDVKPEEVSDYLSKIMNNPKPESKSSEKNFVIVEPSWQFAHVTHEEIHELWENAVMSVRSPMDYRQDLHDALVSKFEFYNIAVKNKEASLKQAAEDKAAEEAKIAKEASEAETANKLSAIATTHTATPVQTHKDLKKVYSIDMVGENWEDATMVMTAFVANLEKCKAEIRVKNIWNLSIAQMSVALCNIKNKDENFAFGNLKFKLMDKL